MNIGCNIPTSNTIPSRWTCRKASGGVIFSFMDEQPLLKPGFHDLLLDDLKESLSALCVQPFENRYRREELLDRFLDFLRESQSLGIFTELWLDGSFLTDKESPNDIDLVLFFESLPYQSFSPREQKAYRELTDVDRVKSRFGCDVYFVRAGKPEHQRYWRGLFGFSRDGVPKGIVRIYLRRPT